MSLALPNDHQLLDGFLVAAIEAAWAEVQEDEARELVEEMPALCPGLRDLPLREAFMKLFVTLSLLFMVLPFGWSGSPGRFQVLALLPELAAQSTASAAQQLAHHTTAGSPMNAGDLLGSGTISGPTRPERGSMLELSWGGKEPLTLESGETRSFLQDGDTVTFSGHAAGAGYRIGFGTCSGLILAALDDPFER